MQDARGRNNKLTAKWNRNADVDVHARFERDSRIVENEAHGYGARRDIDLRQDLINASFERTSWIGINRYCGGHSWLEGADASLKNVGVYPDCGKVCDGVKLRFRLHVLIGKCVEFGDVAGCRRIDGHIMLRCACLLQSGDLAWRHAKLAQTIGSSLKKPIALVRCSPMRVAHESLLVLLGQQILLLGTDQIGAVDGEQRLPLAHV